MTATTMHFGPEWMRPKHPSRSQNASPPPSNHPSHGPSSYSSLVAAPPNITQDRPDAVNPFKYSKEDLVRVYKEGGGRGGLGLEVERWEGVVREVGSEPVALKEWSDAEKKLFSGSLNSEVRRRQSTDYLSPLSTPSGERPKMTHAGSGVASPMRERFGNLAGRGRAGSDQPSLAIPRKLSLSSIQPLGSPREGGLSSPRTRGPTTPGFDGILNSGETWTSRRRASESASRANNSTMRGEGDGEAPNGTRLKIDEEEEHRSADSGWEDRRENGTSHDHNPTADEFRPPSGPPRSTDSPLSGVNGSLSMSNPSLNEQHGVPQAPNDSTRAQTGLGPPSAVPQAVMPDVASTEWSYLDPQGQIQGPFRADLMQKWYDEGYFTPDLLMKRTKFDTEWIAVGEMARRAGGEKVFLTPFDNEALPPGLPRRRDSPFDAYSQSRDAGGFNGPYQPIPTRSLHPSALEPYFATSSPASNSPSSSFSAGRFGNGSPDTSAYPGRMAHMFASNDSPVVSRVSSFAEPANYGGVRRPGFNDQPYDPGFAVRPGPVRTPSLDSFAMGNQPLSNQMSWSSPVNIHGGLNGNRTNSLDSSGPYTHHLGSAVDPSFPAQSPLSRNVASASLHQEGLRQGYSNISAVSQRDLARLGSRDPYLPEHKIDTQLGVQSYEQAPNPAAYDSPIQSQAFSQSPSLNFAPTPPQGHSLNHIGQTIGSMTSARQVGPQSSPSVQPPWNANTESQPKRTGLPPFDPSVFPTSRNTISTRVVTSSQSSSWATPKLPARQPSASADQSQSPWFVASQSVVDDGWGQVNGPNSLTVSNLGQHNQQQEQEAALAGEEESPIVESPVESSQPGEQLLTGKATAASTEASPETPVKARRKSSTGQVAAVSPADKPSVTSAQPPKAPSPAPPAKPVWSTEAEAKKQTSAPKSLREIQEAEAKRQEARKAADRERGVRATSLTSPQPDDAQPFTASWGLPTSQVGSTRAAAPAKDAASPSSASSPAIPGAPTAVWTNTVKPAVAKKTMKEIQEEEERRKKAVSKETAAAAARRAYAETTNKSSTPAVSAGGAWTTVGATKPVAAPSTARPVLTPSPSTSSATATPTRPSTVASVARTPVPATIKSVSSTPKIDDTPVAPSADFMKWMSDSLKGLNSSVNYEEIASMLLSFPLEVDATTMEIISELVYDNSPTLDGRRFAQEFVTKRKADAASRKGGTLGRLPSIADVVKAQPKPTQQAEWGGFKVVNKKKKGSRA